ncbi:Na+/H+ antiporter subunit E [Novosphingobium sp. PhB165]|uniref:Na+/H+ antiporter subunit E n=1 Tax=Novosphingobium sp. PhB165 TaxID=2485105 RepID=UPI0014050156|nr:Na+/H+ antiporter subunit E [Novosphingobium sp. PhB165]
MASTGKLPSRKAAAIARGISYLALWLIMMPSARPTDLLVGAGAAIAATWLSLRTFPPATGCLHFVSMAALMPHFIWQSVRAGFDIARRVFDPRLPIQPGFVACPLGFPEGLARNTFATITSLIPGTVPCGEVDGVLTYHCLDLRNPVVQQLWAEERLMARALIAGRRHD